MIETLKWFLTELVLTPQRVQTHAYGYIFVFFLVFVGLQQLLGYHDFFLWPQWYRNWINYQTSQRNRKEIQSRMVSTLHALVVGVACSINIFVDREWIEHTVTCCVGPTDFQTITFSFSIAYFLADQSFIVPNAIGPLLPICLHHTFSAWGFLACLDDTSRGVWYGVLLLTTELSTPVNNLFWFLTNSPLAGSSVHKMVQWIYAISWLIFRTAVNPVIIWRLYVDWKDIETLMSPYLRFLLFFNIAFLMLLNTIWLVIGPWPWNKTPLVPEKTQSEKDKKNE